MAAPHATKVSLENRAQAKGHILELDKGEDGYFLQWNFLTTKKYIFLKYFFNNEK